VSVDRDFAERVKAFFPLEDVVAKHVEKLKRSGQNLVACCPFHNEKTPSFNVRLSKQTFHCFGCQESGDVIKFLMKIEGRSFPDVIKDMAKEAGVPVPEDFSWNPKKKRQNSQPTRPNIAGNSPGDGALPTSETSVKSGSASRSASSDEPASDEIPLSDEEFAQRNKEIDAISAEVARQGQEMGLDLTVENSHPAPGEAGQKSEGVGVPPNDPVPGEAGQKQSASVGASRETPQSEGEDQNKIVPGPGAERDSKNTQEKKSKVRVLPDLPEASWPRAMQLLQAFYNRLTITDHDVEGLFSKRGLEEGVTERLGFRSNQKSNAEILEEVGNDYYWRDRVESGLFLYNAAKRQTWRSRQFHGWGLVGRETVNGEKKEKWDWNQPVLIPYFDGAGNLEGLRPHKGGSKRTRYARPRLYVPREEGVGTKRGYNTVVITESEFKCAALWQILGEGSDLPEEDVIGVCGLPGIQQFKNIFIENDLKDFLVDAGPRKVVVVFDSEEKSNPDLPGYNQLFERRYDSDIYSLVLTERIKIWLPTAKVQMGMLPSDWRDDSGKADWDGVLSRMLGGQIELLA
jgi:hypothetical protein